MTAAAPGLRTQQLSTWLCSGTQRLRVGSSEAATPRGPGSCGIPWQAPHLDAAAAPIDGWRVPLDPPLVAHQHTHGQRLVHLPIVAECRERHQGSGQGRAGRIPTKGLCHSQGSCPHEGTPPPATTGTRPEPPPSPSLPLFGLVLARQRAQIGGDSLGQQRLALESGRKSPLTRRRLRHCCRQGPPPEAPPPAAQRGHCEQEGLSVLHASADGSSSRTPAGTSGSHSPPGHSPVHQRDVREPDVVRENPHGGDPFVVSRVPGKAVVDPALAPGERKRVGARREQGEEEGGLSQGPPSSHGVPSPHPKPPPPQRAPSSQSPWPELCERSGYDAHFTDSRMETEGAIPTWG